MPWGRVDDTHYDHQKVRALPRRIRNSCVGLYWRSISWSNSKLSDGFVPTDELERMDARESEIEGLVAVGLFEPAKGGIQIHDFLDFNRSRAEILAERAAARDRMAAKRSGNVRRNNGAGSGNVQANKANVPANGRARTRIARESRPDPSRPDSESLSEEDSKPSRAGDRVDLAALLERGWKRVTPSQRRLLDEVLDRHDVTGAAWAARIIRATPPDSDPLAAVRAADSAWQRAQREGADAADADWAARKAAERVAAPAALAALADRA